MTVDDRRNILSQAILGTVDANRQAWLEERKLGIRGSEAAVCHGGVLQQRKRMTGGINDATTTCVKPFEHQTHAEKEMTQLSKS